jgi:hypothetical protein
LDGLDAGDIIEEPAATGVHELGVAFEFEQFQQSDALFGRDVPLGVQCEEAVDRRRRAVEDDVDVVVARTPEVDEQRRDERFGQRRGGVAQEVEGLAQRRAPLLVQARLAAVAAAVGAPALYAMHTAP